MTPHQSEEVKTNELTIGSVLKTNIKINAFILVEFKYEKTGRPTYYVAKVLANPQDNDIKAIFLKKSAKVCNKFVLPPVEVDVKAILPDPVSRGTTSRTKRGTVFDINFGNLNIR